MEKQHENNVSWKRKKKSFFHDWIIIEERVGLRFIVLIVAVTVVVLGTDLDDSVGSLGMVCWYMLLDWPFSNYLNFSNFSSVSIKQNSASMNSITIIYFI